MKGDVKAKALKKLVNKEKGFEKMEHGGFKKALKEAHK